MTTLLALLSTVLPPFELVLLARVVLDWTGGAATVVVARSVPP